MNLLCVGASYRTADVGILEQIAITAADLPTVLQRLIARWR